MSAVLNALWHLLAALTVLWQPLTGVLVYLEVSGTLQRWRRKLRRTIAVRRAARP